MAEDLREFVRVYYNHLLRTAFLLTGSSHAAEDLVQTALLGAMRRWERIDDPVAYLRRAMLNRRVSLWRRVGSREVLTAVLPEQVGRALLAPDHAHVVAQRGTLLAALGRLPARMRAVLVLRYWEDLSEAQTAEVLGCSPGTVKSQASRGLARLRASLADSEWSGRPRPVGARMREATHER